MSEDTDDDTGDLEMTTLYADKTPTSVVKAEIEGLRDQSFSTLISQMSA